MRDVKGKMLRIELDPVAADALVTVTAKILDDGWSVASAARWLDERGIRTASGGRWVGDPHYSCRSKACNWHDETAPPDMLCPRCGEGVKNSTPGRGLLLSQVLRQPRVAGILEHKGEEIGKSEHIPAILTERRWRALVARLDSRAGQTRGASGGARRGYLLTGQDSPARCEVCGSAMTSFNGLPSKSATEKVRYLKCIKGCVSVRMDLAEQEIVSRMLRAAAESGRHLLPGEERPDTSADEDRLAEIDEELEIWRCRSRAATPPPAG